MGARSRTVSIRFPISRLAAILVLSITCVLGGAGAALAQDKPSMFSAAFEQWDPAAEKWYAVEIALPEGLGPLVFGRVSIHPYFGEYQRAIAIRDVFEVMDIHIDIGGAREIHVAYARDAATGNPLLRLADRWGSVWIDLALGCGADSWKPTQIKPASLRCDRFPVAPATLWETLGTISVPDWIQPIFTRRARGEPEPEPFEFLGPSTKRYRSDGVAGRTDLRSATEAGVGEDASGDWLRGGSYANGVIRRLEDGETAVIGLRPIANQRRFSDGDPIWDTIIEAEPYTELGEMSARSRLTSEGEFEVTRRGNMILIEGIVINTWVDRYSWDKIAEYDIPGFGKLRGADFKELEEAGLAAPFNMVSRWARRVTGHIEIGRDGRLGEPQMEWGDVME